MPFKKGQSGNPGGRPPKSRALTDILAARGGHKVEIGGKKMSGAQLISQLLWEIATTGKATFPDNTLLEVGPRDWLETVKWIYAHIDGPPKGQPEEPPDEDAGLTFDQRVGRIIAIVDRARTRRDRQADSG